MLAIEREENGQLNLLKTILAAAHGSVESREYQRIFIQRAEGDEDVTYNGEYSCAISTTAIYHRFGPLKETHTTVQGFEDEVRASGDWLEIDEPMPGAIGILEGKRHPDGSVKNRHTFICVGDGMAVHNGLEDGVWAPRLCEISSFRHHTGEQRFPQTYFIHRALLPG
jgi:hypothetical protein